MDRSHFLDAICRDTSTAAPLVFADWLEEQRGERDLLHSELIRIQCALDGEPPMLEEAIPTETKMLGTFLRRRVTPHPDLANWLRSLLCENPGDLEKRSKELLTALRWPIPDAENKAVYDRGFLVSFRCLRYLNYLVKGGHELLQYLDLSVGTQSAAKFAAESFPRLKFLNVPLRWDGQDNIVPFLPHHRHIKVGTWVR